MSTTEWTLVITAMLTGAAGLITAIASMVSAKSKGDAECEGKLHSLRVEVEHLAGELHERRMQDMGHGPA